MGHPMWLDIFGLGLNNGVRQLFDMTGARDYACSEKDYIAQGWEGNSCKYLTHDGSVLVHPSPYIPEHTLFALPEPEQTRHHTSDLQEIRDDLRKLTDKVIGKIK